MREAALFEIDYDNLTVTKETVLDRAVFTIDNFYKYPNAVSKYVDKLEMPPSEVNYPGNQIWLDMDIFKNHAHEVKHLLMAHGLDSEKFISIDKCVSNPVHMWAARLVNQELHNKKNADVGDAPVLANPHNDTDFMEDPANFLAGICYLSKNSIHGGTGLYRVKKNGRHATDWKYHYENMSILAGKLAGISDSIERNKIIDNHNSDEINSTCPHVKGCINESDDYFERVHFFPMKFNRLILYDGDFLHSMCIEDEQFYNDLNHTRQTMNYAFLIDWGVTRDELSLIEQLRLETKRDGDPSGAIRGGELVEATVSVDIPFGRSEIHI